MIDVKFVSDEEGLIKAREDILKYDVIGWDTETKGAGRDGLDPHKGKLRLLQLSTNPNSSYVFDIDELRDPRYFTFFADILGDPKKIVIAQNAKFDLQFFTKFMDQGPLEVESIYDTFIASKLLSFDRDRVALKNGKSSWVDPLKHNLLEIAKRECGIVLDKSFQTSDWSNTLSDTQKEYAARDASILHRIREVQIPRFHQHQLGRVARLEFDFISSVADLELNGFYLDSEQWLERIERQKSKHEELKKEILDTIAPHCIQIDLFGEPVINIDSPAQIGPMLQRCGVPIGHSTSEDELKQYASDYGIVKTLIDYREMATALKKFGPEYLKFVHPVTKRIHADFQQITAPSGRMSCNNPNLQQVTQDPEYRSCYKAQSGTLITADYGQIELRIMAMQSKDPQLMKVFMEGLHLHKHTAHVVLGQPYDNPDPHQYRIAKNLNFGATYGAGPPRFAVVAGITESEAESALKKFWSAYCVLDQHMKTEGRKCATTGITRTHSGRMVKLNFDHDDRSAFSSAERLGRNFKVQGTGADILKRACYLLRKKQFQFGVGIKMVNLVHDEIVVETDDDSDEVSLHIHDAMHESGQAVLGKIPCTVDIKVSEAWEK